MAKHRGHFYARGFVVPQAVVLQNSDGHVNPQFFSRITFSGLPFDHPSSGHGSQDAKVLLDPRLLYAGNNIVFGAFFGAIQFPLYLSQLLAAYGYLTDIIHEPHCFQPSLETPARLFWSQSHFAALIKYNLFPTS